MSSTLAFATPLRAPREQARERHIEIVATRAQKKARPRVHYAIVAVAGLFALFVVQLLLSIVVSDGAYRVAGLQTEQRDLGRQQQALSEQLDLLASPQNLAMQAEGLGMVLSSTSPVFLRVTDGAVLGSDATNGAGDTVIGTGGDRVPNALLGSVPLVASEAAAKAAAAAAEATAADTAAAGTAAADTTAATSTAAEKTSAAASTGTGSTVVGAPDATLAAESVASNPVALPSPVTR
ncbi:MAG: hypothetical protein JWM51_1842 [Microbacteriaceae bacterium]|nr:hypothetical protein [Microbacteriaceae bacterium]